MQLLGGQQRKALRQVEADLAAEHAQRPGAGAIIAPHAVVEDVAQQVQILEFGMIGRRGRNRPGAGLQVSDLGQGVHAPKDAADSCARSAV